MLELLGGRRLPGTRQRLMAVRVRKQGHRGRNTLIGLGIGAGAGAVLGAATHRDCDGLCILTGTRGQDAALGAGAIGIIGTLVGVLLPTGGWTTVYQP